MATNSTRRALIVATALTAMAPLPAAGRSSAGTAAKWQWYTGRLQELSNGDFSDQAWDHVFKVETEILKGPIGNDADAAVKLRAVNLSFERGERGDEEDVRALANVIEWLERR